jgi:hypothetical protein
MADIRFLLQLLQVDGQEVRSYFVRHGLGVRFDDVEKSLCAARRGSACGA